MSKLLTVAIPAYNAEQYISRCLESLLIEDIKDLVQIIVVNDGSKDRTLEIAQSYEMKYSDFIQVIDKENGNYGSVMNIALENAKGKYFRTLDSDDWYNTNEFVKFVKVLTQTNADMIVCEYEEFYEISQEKKKVKIPYDILQNTDISIHDVLFKKITSFNFISTPNVCYKTSILRQSGLNWSEKVFYSDTEYLYWPLTEVHNIRFVNIPVYVYLIGRDDQSMSPSVLKRNFSSIYVVTTKIINHFLETEKVNPDIYPLRIKYIKQILYFFFLGLFFSPDYKLKIVDLVRSLEKQKDLIDFSYKTTYHKLHFVKSYVRSKFKIEFNLAKFLFIHTDKKSL